MNGIKLLDDKRLRFIRHHNRDKDFSLNMEYRPVEYDEKWKFERWFLDTFPEFTGETSMKNFCYGYNHETCEDLLEYIRKECEYSGFYFKPSRLFKTIEKCYSEIFLQAYKISKNERYNISPIHMKYILRSCVIEQKYYEYHWTLIVYQIMTINSGLEAISEQILFDDLYNNYFLYFKEDTDEKVLKRAIKEFMEFYDLNDMTKFKEPPTKQQLSKKFKVPESTVTYDIRKIEKLLRTVLKKDRSARHWMFYSRKTIPLPEWLDKVREYPSIRKSSENEDITN